MNRHLLDSSVRRAGDDGVVLIGGSPLVLMRLTTAGSVLLDRIQNGEPIAPTPATTALVDRLVDCGILHPCPLIGSGPSPGDVTVVIPAFGTDAATLVAIVAGCPGVAAVIVVDDASRRPIAPVVGATVIRHECNRGPGAARTTGLAATTTPYVAFVDADVIVTAGWLDGLLAHHADDRVALVAPRVVSTAGPGRLARYESVRSPLDLGPAIARVRAGTRVSYVPSAAILCRVKALRGLEGVAGFDARLRFGEDVDLVWRLDEAGWQIRYAPGVIVHHEPRATWRGWMAQRAHYGGSAAPLAARHPGALAPVRVSRWSAATWLAIAAGWPLLGGLISVATTAALARRLRTVPGGRRIALRLAGLGHLYAGRSLAAGVTRSWWPFAVVAAVASHRARRAVIAAAAIPAIIDWVRTRPPLDLATYVGLRIVDDASYGAGLVAGAVRARSLDALRPDFSSWPNRPTGTRTSRPGPKQPDETRLPAAH